MFRSPAFFALCLGLTIGCSQHTGSLPIPAGPHGSVAMQPQTYASVYNFSGGADGMHPLASLASFGNMYGTTNNGGSGSSFGFGTVFMMTSMGESVVYRFAGGSDGAIPRAGLTVVATIKGRALYGTTAAGGNGNHGTVFTLTPRGVNIVYRFTGGADGAQPQASLIADANGNLYGTTFSGGTSGKGTVFKIDPSGVESVLHSFTDADGANPDAALILGSGGRLYGTTYQGGTRHNGTVFKLTSTGTGFAVLHSFTGNPDGAFPEAGLLAVSGTLYGTTNGGGTTHAGTVFKVMPSGSGYAVLHSFTGTPDGAYPDAGLIVYNGKFYGTTASGGTSNEGTVFKLTPSGSIFTETVLHSFTGHPADGAYPQAGLLAQGGFLNGTTTFGGTNNLGTVFQVSP